MVKPKKIKPPAKMGRPTSWTPEVAKAIIASIRESGADFLAAEKAGIHRNSLSNWKALAKEGVEPYATFFIDVDAARAEFCAQQMLWLARSKDARSRQWLLERIEPALRAPQQRVGLEVSGVDGAPIRSEHVVLTTEQAQAIRSQILGVDSDEDGKGE